MISPLYFTVQANLQINQSINQSVSQSVSQSVNRSIDQLIIIKSVTNLFTYYNITSNWKSIGVVTSQDHNKQITAASYISNYIIFIEKEEVNLTMRNLKG